MRSSRQPCSEQRCDVRKWPMAVATPAGRWVRLPGCCGLSLALAAPNRVPCPPASAIGANPAAAVTKLGGP